MLQKLDSFEVKGDLPGVKEENVKLSVDGDVLSLSVENVGEKKDEVKEEVSAMACSQGNAAFPWAYDLPKAMPL